MWATHADVHCADDDSCMYLYRAHVIQTNGIAEGEIERQREWEQKSCMLKRNVNKHTDGKRIITSSCCCCCGGYYCCHCCCCCCLCSIDFSSKSTFPLCLLFYHFQNFSIFILIFIYIKYFVVHRIHLFGIISINSLELWPKVWLDTFALRS